MPPYKGSVPVVGALDTTNACDAGITGWACVGQKASPQASVEVDFYADRPYNPDSQRSGIFMGATYTKFAPSNASEKAAIENFCGTSLVETSKFIFQIPEQFKDGVVHSVYMYGIPFGNGLPQPLYNSGRTFQCAKTGIGPGGRKRAF